METNDKDRIKNKIKFYFSKKIKSHISIIPRGLKNGFFESDLIEETYYWFTDDVEGKIRVYLCDIFNVCDFREDREVCKK